jgi:hypothetical protein
MTTNIRFIGTTAATEHLHDKTFAAEIIYLGGGLGDELSNMHLIKLPDKNLTFDLKDTKIHDLVILFGILGDGDKVGRVAIQLN